MKRYIIKSILWYIPIMCFILTLVYISGFFIELADSAYFDIFRSVTIPYIVYIIYLVYLKHYRNRTCKNNPICYKNLKITKLQTSTNKNASKIKKINIIGWIKKDQNVLFDICEVFMLVTVVNSFMMVLTIDIPKIGKFSYIHLLMRLSIISVIMIVFRGSKFSQDIKNIITTIKEISSSRNNIKKSIEKNIIKYKYRTIYLLFSTITITTCVTSVLFLPNPSGGIGLYFNLLIMFGIVSILILLISIINAIKTR